MSPPLAASAFDPRIVEFLLARGRPGAGIEPLSGDASTRRYFRVGDGGDRFVLALHPEPFEPAGMPFLEVRELLAGWGLPVPALLGEDAGRGILALEDLGDTTLQEALRAASPRERDSLYAEALEQLVRLQREAALAPRRAGCYRIAFDVEKLAWELHYFEKHFLEGLRGRELSVEDRATLAESFHRLAEEIASWPRVLCHRDYHSRNLMLHRGTLYWIDFQDARMGPATYDLASLLRDSYVDLPEDLVAGTAEAFRLRALPGEAPESFSRRFQLTSVQRNLKALGTFGFMTVVRGSAVYLPYVPRTLAHLRRNLPRHPELDALRRVLARHLEELR